MLVQLLIINDMILFPKYKDIKSALEFGIGTWAFSLAKLYSQRAGVFSSIHIFYLVRNLCVLVIATYYKCIFLNIEISYYISNKLPKNLISDFFISHFVCKYAFTTGINFNFQYQENS